MITTDLDIQINNKIEDALYNYGNIGKVKNGFLKEIGQTERETFENTVTLMLNNVRDDTGEIIIKS